MTKVLINAQLAAALKVLTKGLTRGFDCELDRLVVDLCVFVLLFILCGFHLHTLLRTLGERIHPYVGTGGRGLIQVY